MIDIIQISKSTMQSIYIPRGDMERAKAIYDKLLLIDAPDNTHLIIRLKWYAKRLSDIWRNRAMIMKPGHIIVYPPVNAHYIQRELDFVFRALGRDIDNYDDAIEAALKVAACIIGSPLA